MANEKKKPTTNNRGVRIPVSLDRWLVEKAKGGGFRSVPEVIIDLVRKAKESEETAKAA